MNRQVHTDVFAHVSTTISQTKDNAGDTPKPQNMIIPKLSLIAVNMAPAAFVALESMSVRGLGSMGKNAVMVCVLALMLHMLVSASVRFTIFHKTAVPVGRHE